MLRRTFLFLAAAASCLRAKPPSLFSRENLFAWCIVPFDAKKRGPHERMTMLRQLGLRAYAYDYRAEHVPTFDAEISAARDAGVQIIAWWFPTTLNDEARLILEACARGKISPQLWVMGAGAPAGDAATQAARIEAEATRIRPIAEAAARIGSKVALYNHGGWFGEPENQIAIIERLSRDGLRNVGIVYNLHHGHAHLDRFPTLWRAMQPHLLAVNLNGMDPDGESRGRKIIPLGTGLRDADLLRVIAASGWRGPVGIIDHRPETDSAETLAENLRGLDQLVATLEK